jgi:hypothetical protein
MANSGMTAGRSFTNPTVAICRLPEVMQQGIVALYSTKGEAKRARVFKVYKTGTPPRFRRLHGWRGLQRRGV